MNPLPLLPLGSAIATFLASLAALGLPGVAAVAGAIVTLALLVPHLFWHVYLPLQALKADDRAVRAQALLNASAPRAIDSPRKKRWRGLAGRNGNPGKGDA